VPRSPGGVGGGTVTEELFLPLSEGKYGPHFTSAGCSGQAYFFSFGIQLNCLAYLKTIGYKLIPFKISS
jgi:hypothetical protein